MTSCRIGLKGHLLFQGVTFTNSQKIHVSMTNASVSFDGCLFSENYGMNLLSQEGSKITLVGSSWIHNQAGPDSDLLKLDSFAVSIVNCTFFENGIFFSLVNLFESGTLEIDSCTFTSNIVNAGLIIVFGGDSFIVRDSTFFECTSMGDLIGSGITSFSNCKWEKNSRSKGEGPLLLDVQLQALGESGSVIFSFENCSIVGNEAHSNEKSPSSSVSCIQLQMQRGIFQFLNNSLANNFGMNHALEVYGSATSALSIIGEWIVHSGVGGIYFRDGNAILRRSSFSNLAGQAIVLDHSELEVFDVKMQDSFVSVENSVSLLQIAGDSSLKIDSCVFQNISSRGGLIASQFSSLSILNTLFDQIGADSSRSCISINYGDLTIKSTNFTSNIAIQAAGIEAKAVKSILIENVFAGESLASKVAFAILQSLSLMIRNSSFTAGFAEKGSGALSLSGKIVLDNVVFTQNRADDGSGAIEFSDGYLDVQNCVFEENQGTKGTVSVSSLCQSEWRDCTFELNLMEFGGALVAEGEGSHLFDNCNFLYNSASGSGGVAVLSENVNASFIGCDFGGNSAEADGGAMMVTDRAFLRLQSCYFNLNSAEGTGGALFFSKNSQGFVVDTKINENTAKSGGGASFSNSCGPSFERVNFTGNSAVGGGGVKMVDIASPTFSECVFEFNLASSEGGGSQASINSIPVFSRCSFSQNDARGNGGGALDQDFSTSVYFDCDFLGNRASSGGGLYTSSENGPTVTHTSFVRNSASLGGGAFTVGRRSEAKFSHITCEQNEAIVSGGCASIMEMSNPFIADLMAVSNTAFSQGGALYLGDLSTPTIIDSLFASNSCPTGGALVTSEFSRGRLSDCVFRHNQASNRGGAVLYQGLGMVFQNTSFEDNFGGAGGGMYLEGEQKVYGSSTICLNCTFKGNTAQQGAGLFVSLSGSADDSPLEDHLIQSFVQCDFLNNSAQEDGGGLYVRLLSLTTVTFSECRFIGNSAGNFGGGLFIGPANLLVNIPDSYWMFDSIFRINTAYSAGDNAAWEVPPNNAEISGKKNDYFCNLCDYELKAISDFGSYSNIYGFATPPQVLRLFGGRPSSIFVDQTPFFVTLEMDDAFGSNVVGHIFETNNWTVHRERDSPDPECELSADSPLEQSEPFSQYLPVASFDNLILYTKNGDRCSIRFYN